MTILTTIPNGASMKDARDTINGILADVAALKAGGSTPAPTPTVSLASAAASANEGADGTTLNWTYTVSRSTSVGTVSVPWTFSAGTTDAADWNGGVLPAGGTLAFASGEISKSFTITSKGDGIVEGNETFSVAISVPSGYAAGTTTSATGTILNDDVAATALPQASKIAHTMFTEDIPAQADNTALASWTDSKSGVQWTQATASAQPKYRTNRFAGKPTVQFAGAQYFKANRAQAMIDTIGAAHTRMFIFSNIGDASTAGGTGAIFGVNGANGYEGRVWDTVNTGNGIGSTYVCFPWTNIGFTTVIHDKATSKLYINGSMVTNGNGSGAFSHPSYDFTLGSARDNPGDAYGFLGELLGVVIWNGTGLTQPEALQAHKWACDKYAQPYPWANITRFVCFVGDSITNSQPQGSYPTYIAQDLGLACGTWANLGQDGAVMLGTVNNCDTMAAIHADPIPGVIGKPILNTVMEWANQANGDLTQNQNALVTYLANRKAANASTKNIVMNSSAMSQDVDSNGVKTAAGTKREQYNTFAMGLTANVDGKVDIGADALIGVVGANDSAGAKKYFDDGIGHPTRSRTGGTGRFAVLIGPEVNRVRQIA